MIPLSLLKTRFSITKIGVNNNGREIGREHREFLGYLEESKNVVRGANGSTTECSHTLVCGTDVTLAENDRFSLEEIGSGMKPRRFLVVSVEKPRWPSTGVIHHQEIYIQ